MTPMPTSPEAASEFDDRDNHALLGLAVRITRVGGWSADLRTRRMQWSREVALIHETPPGWAPTIDERIAYYAVEHRAVVTDAFTRCAERGEPYDLELQILTARGRRVWVRTAGRAERDDRGHIVRVVGAFADIDERKRGQIALSRMNRLYALQGGIAEAVVSHTDDARALLQRVCDIAVERGGFAFAWAAQRTEAGRSEPLCAAGNDAGYLALVRQRAADPGFDCWPLADAIAEGRFLDVEETATDPRLGAWAAPMVERGWRTAAVVPLPVAGHRRLGLVLLGADPQAFDADAIQLLVTSGHTLSHALEAFAQRAQRDGAEASLRRSEADLSQAQRIARVGGWTYDLRTRRLCLSVGAMAALGLVAEPFDGTTAAVLQWVHPQDRRRVQAAVRAAVRGGAPFDVECRVLRADGGVTWAHARADHAAQRDGRELQVGSVIDITERKLAELRLREQVERLALLDGITRAIGERLDLDDVLRIVAAQVAAHLPADLCALLLRDDTAPGQLRLGAVAGSTAPGAAAALGAAVAAPDAAASVALAQPLALPSLADAADPVLRCLAGAGLGCAVWLPLDRPGEPLGLMLVARCALRGFGARDVDFLRQLAEHAALATRQARLHGALRQAYDTLERTQAATLQQERLAALGAMAGGMAHDINNALSPAALYLESLLAREAGLSARGRGQLAAIQRAIEDVAGTVAQLREFSRAGSNSAVQASTDLDALVSDVARQCAPKQASIVVRLELDGALPPVRAAQGELREALAALIRNAVEAMPDGGTLTLRTRRGASGGATIEVADDGVGMDEATRRRCVEPFFSTKGGRGTGLGLSAVYGIAERHRARLEIHSAPGRGSTLGLHFPPLPPAGPAVCDASARVAASCSATEQAATLRVLLVDDDELLRQSLAQALAHDGHHITPAVGGREAIDAATAAAAEGEPFDLVLTDLAMPGIDGHQVAAAVKRLRPAPRVAMLTGWAHGAGAGDGCPEHVDRLLAKPLRLAELRAALRELSPADAR